jgi:splicing factor 3B subunit 1
MLDGVAAVVNSFRERVKPYLPQICGTLKWRLNNKSAKVRQQAADLIGKTSAVMKRCGEEQLLNHLGVVLYEYLGEEYPEVLGSILGGLKGIVNVVGMAKMTPPIKDLLPRLTPILRNRHEKVQENCIDLVGRIADRGAEFVSAKEWMRICFELLDMLKAHKKAIRRATVNTFGYIAKAIGPQDVLAVLLNNLKVQERQNRVCTTVAIAIVAETCGPFTVLPALLNEYRLPELNVQNGVLKALSFLFEYIGEMGKDYVYAVTPLLEDALMDRDLVHRQTASTVVKHLTLGVFGLGCEDALAHLLNFVWPNIFEQSPHVINAVMEAIEAMRVSLGASRVLQHCLQVRPAVAVEARARDEGVLPAHPTSLRYPESLVILSNTFLPSVLPVSCWTRCELPVGFPEFFECVPFLSCEPPDSGLKYLLTIGCLGRGGMLGLQGLFHPARKVREVYWKIYNGLYIGSQDALVAAYPMLEDDDLNQFRRTELDYVI